MSDESGAVDIFFTVFNYTALELLGTIFSLLAFIVIFIACLKMVRTPGIPGAKLLFYSVIVILAGTIIAFGFLLIGEEENYLVEAIFSLLIGIAIFSASYGFLRIAKHISQENANKSLNSQPPAAGTPQSGAP